MIVNFQNKRHTAFTAFIYVYVIYIYIKNIICGFQHLERNTWLFEKEIYSEEFITQFRRNVVTCVFILKQLERFSFKD